jgi:predicted metal-dependent HD superfamily phosphohydrolase
MKEAQAGRLEETMWQWHDLCRRFEADQAATEQVAALLLGLYTQKSRHYHTLEHIGHCLEEFRPIEHIFGVPETVELAIWFHDAVYDARDDRNEQASACLAECCISALVRDGEKRSFFINQVMFMVKCTAHGGSSNHPPASAQAFLLDIDLAILGRPDGEFDRYEENIRKEYGWVPENVFRAKRTELLKDFLDRPSIYLTAHFQEKYEKAARRNLKRSLKNLSTLGW